MRLLGCVMVAMVSVVLGGCTSDGPGRSTASDTTIPEGTTPEGPCRLYDPAGTMTAPTGSVLVYKRVSERKLGDTPIATCEVSGGSKLVAIVTSSLPTDVEAWSQGERASNDELSGSARDTTLDGRSARIWRGEGRVAVQMVTSRTTIYIQGGDDGVVGVASDLVRQGFAG